MCHHYESTPEWEALVEKELTAEADEEELGADEPELGAPTADD